MSISLASATGAFLRRKVFTCVTALLVGVTASTTCAPSLAAWTGVASTNTTLTTSLSGSLATAVATVSSGGSRVTGGTVTFTEGSKVLGVVQVVSSNAAGFTPGTATLKAGFAVGAHNIVAKYNGDLAFGASSATAGFSVPGSAVATSTTMSASGTTGNYTLTGTVTSSGSSAITGSLSFLDASNNDAVLGSAPLVATSAPQTLASPQIYSPSGMQYSRTIRIADVNGDGSPDMVMASYQAIYVALGDSNHPGTFLPAISYGSAQNILGVAVADMNGDGLPDIVYGSNSNVYVMLGDPANPGKFLAQSAYATGGYDAFGVTIGDVDGDGVPDVVVANQEYFSYSTLKGDPSHPGQLQAGVLTTLINPYGNNYYGDAYSVDLQDLNNDGKLDLVVGGYISSIGGYGFAVLLADPNNPGKFLSPTYYNTTNFSEGLEIADFNHDGLLDIASPGSGVQVFLADPTNPGHFLNSTTYSTNGTYTYAVAGSDLNGDGYTDLVLGTESNVIYVLLADSAHPGQFLSASPYAQGGQISLGVAAGDLNQDGVPDIAVADYYGTNGYYNSNFSVILNQATQSATATLSGVFVPGVGTHNVQASYVGDSAHSSSMSGSTALQGSSTTTTTSLGISPANGLTGGQTATLTATISPASNYGHSASGTVTFSEDGIVIGTGSVNNGTATMTTPALVVGSHNFTAKYAGDTNFIASSSQQLAAVVAKVPTTVTLGAQPGSGVVYGGTVALTATVKPGSQYSPSASGQVTFFDGAVQIGSVALSSGTANINSPRLAVGPHNFSATYAGDTNYVAATGSASMTVGKAASTTALVASPASGLHQYQAITFTATVTGSYTAPSGSVTFTDGSTVLGTSNISNGKASITIAGGPFGGLSAGSHTFKATYNGDGNYNVSTNQLPTYNVLPGTPVSAAYDKTTFNYPTQINLIGTVKQSGPIPTGNLQVYDGTTQIANLVVQGNSNVYWNTYPALTPGKHNLVLFYDGDKNYPPGLSAVTVITVNPAITTMNVSCWNPQFNYGADYTCTVNVSSTAGPGTGNINYSSDVASGTATLKNGQVQFSLSKPNVGNHSITISYAGSNPYGAAPAPQTFKFAVVAAVSQVQLTPSTYNAAHGQSVTFTAKVTSWSAAPPTTGTVTFKDNSTNKVLGTVAVNAGTASVATTLTAGQHVVVASYAGNGNYAAGTSPAVTLQAK